MSKVDLGSSEVHLTLPADDKKLREMVFFLKSDMEEHNVLPQKQFNVISAAEEIFVNISNYAYEGRGKVDIATYVLNGTYYVRFSDKGKKYNPLEREDPDITAELKDRPIGGHGIFLAKRFSDKINYTYENGQNILTIGIDL